ncbi:hypothetical protein D3C72_1550430 [compost metagenome]
MGQSALSKSPNSNPRRWSYEEITETIEKSIGLLLSQSENDRTNSLRDAWVAYGLYVAWSKLTEGQRKPEDDERLHKLTRRFADAP